MDKQICCSVSPWYNCKALKNFQSQKTYFNKDFLIHEDTDVGNW